MAPIFRQTNDKSPSLTAWETIFNPGGSTAIQYRLIELREGADKYNRVYLVALGSITAARSLVEAPVALGRLMIEITEWAVNFERTQGELFKLAYIEVSDCLRCVKMAFIVMGLTVGGTLFPSRCFGALKNLPNTPEIKSVELSKLLQQCKDKQNQVADLQAKITEKTKQLEQTKQVASRANNNLTQILETIHEQQQSLVQAQKLKNQVVEQDEQYSKLQKLSTQLDTNKQTIDQKIQAAKVALADVEGKLTAEQAKLAQSREIHRSLNQEYAILKDKHDTLIKNKEALETEIIPFLTKQIETLHQTLSTNSKELEQLQHQLNELKSQNAKEITDLQQVEKGLQQSIAILQLTLVHVIYERQREEDTLQIIKEKTDDLTQKKTILETELKQLKKAQVAKQPLIIRKDLSKQITKLGEKKKELKIDVNKLEENVHTLNQNLEDNTTKTLASRHEQLNLIMTRTENEKTENEKKVLEELRAGSNPELSPTKKQTKKLKSNIRLEEKNPMNLRSQVTIPANSPGASEKEVTKKSLNSSRKAGTAGSRVEKQNTQSEGKTQPVDSIVTPTSGGAITTNL